MTYTSTKKRRRTTIDYGWKTSQKSRQVLSTCFRRSSVWLVLLMVLVSNHVHEAFQFRSPLSTKREPSSQRTRGQPTPTATIGAPLRSSTGPSSNELSSTNSANANDLDSSKSNNSSPKQHKWTKQTLALALPALIGMLVDPLLSMMDTAYVGNLGSSIELAALGACTSIFHLAFNAFRATTAATTSLVGNASSADEKRSIVRISILLGFSMGLGVGAILRGFGPQCLVAMGVTSNSPLFRPGLAYLRTRSLAAPAVLAVVVAEGAFRGYGDTKIPLLASCTAALVNLILDPVLMLPPLSRGVQGAAAATATAQVGALLVYAWFLTKRKMLPQKESTSNKTRAAASRWRVIKTILGANLAMICKQGSLLLAWAYATAKATRIGAAHVAAHQVALSCWLVFALLQDGAGVAAQVLLAKVRRNENETNEISENETTATKSRNDNSHEKLLSLVKYMLRFSILQGLVVTGGFLLMTPYLPGWFVPDDPIVRGHLKRLLPHVAGQQLLVSLTLILESLAVGGKQFRLLAIGTTLSTVLSISQIRSASTVVGVWSRGIVGLFVGRMVTAAIGTLRVVQLSGRTQRAATKNDA